jgi:hypothetical protein
VDPDKLQRVAHELSRCLTPHFRRGANLVYRLLTGS